MNRGLQEGEGGFSSHPSVVAMWEDSPIQVLAADLAEVTLILLLWF